MIKNVKWFFVVLVFSSVISLAFSKENVHAEKLQEGDKIPALVVYIVELLGKLRCGVQTKQCRIGAFGWRNKPSEDDLCFL